jgi:hypothetical protein
MEVWNVFLIIRFLVRTQLSRISSKLLSATARLLISSKNMEEKISLKKRIN